MIKDREVPDGQEQQDIETKCIHTHTHTHTHTYIYMYIYIVTDGATLVKHPASGDATE
jgi:hypothetical protein